jgi:hypothetical protein
MVCLCGADNDDRARQDPGGSTEATQISVRAGRVVLGGQVDPCGKFNLSYHDRF